MTISTSRSKTARRSSTRWSGSGANQDSSLAFRYSCFNANACKECMVRVDGKTEYACTARLKTGIVMVEPLAKKRLVRDLVTDIVPPKERLRSED